MKSDTLPSEFSELAGHVSYVAKRGVNEWSSSCPSCGGTMHNDGSYPDRFRIFLRSKATGNPRGWCRSCGYQWWPGKMSGSRWTPSNEERARWEAERREREQKIIDDANHARWLLEQENIWQKYHDQLNAEAKMLYAARGIREEYWLDYWGLGYCPEKWAVTNGQNFTSPSLTIPVFEPVTKKVLTVEHRLLRPLDPGDKYRPEMKGLPAVLFSADYEREFSGEVLVVEGKFKAMTTYLCADDPNLHVIGIPGKSPDVELMKQLDKCSPVIICLDPDAYYNQKGGEPAVSRLAKAFGDRARVMQVPGKVDDLISDGIIKKSSLRMLMDTARRIAV